MIGWYDIGLGGVEKTKAMRDNHPNAEIVVFYKSSHDIFDSEPTKFFKKLQRFMTQ